MLFETGVVKEGIRDDQRILNLQFLSHVYRTLCKEEG